MVKLSVDLIEPKDSSKTHKAAQNGRTPKSLTLEIHHGGWLTPTPNMVVKLGYGVEDLMYCHFLISSLGLDYGLHTLNVDADVLEMSKNLTKEWEQVSSKSLSIGEVDMHTLRRQITGMRSLRMKSTRTEKYWKEITEKHMVVHVGNSSTVDDVLELGILFETEGVGHVRKFKEVEVDADNESEEESNTEGDYTMDSDSEDLDYDPKHDDVFDDDEHIIEEVHVNMNNFRFTADPKHDTSMMGSSYREQYSLLREYAQELINQNPGTTVRIDVQQNQSIVSLTRTLEGPWPGQILTAVLVDANKEIYLVAYAIVEAESKAYWCWFLNLTCGRIWYCVRHIHENMKSQFKGGVYKEMLWNAANATSEGEFKKKMGELKSFNSDAYDWLMKIPLEQWSKAHFSGRVKCDLLINNICEVFNRQLVDGRDQPIITCLEYIREYLMKRIVVVQKVIAKTVRPLTLSDQYGVNMDRRVCSSRKWELTGIPCKHVVAVIYNMSENSMRVVVESRTVIILPLYKPQIGRPPKKRKKSNDKIASHNRKGCRGQGGGSSQAGVRKVSSEAAGATIVSGQAAGARKVSSQAAGATNVSGQAAGARKVSGQAADARKASSQPSVAQSIAKKGNLWIFEQYELCLLSCN
ncbi:mutator type transposase [Tanacetum coccineum]